EKEETQKKSNAPKQDPYRGKFTPLSKFLKKETTALEKDAEPTSLVLQTDDGRIPPLVKDGGSRLFYQDTRLLHKPMEIQGRLVAQGSKLQALKGVSLKAGQPPEHYCWREI